MLSTPIRWALFILPLCSAASAQMMSFPASGAAMSSLDAIQRGQLDFNLFLIGSRNPNTTEIQSPDSSVSRLDLKAPGKARREYEHGYRLLMQKDLQGAAEHLSKSIAMYPKFVAAHNALGSTHLKLGENEQAYNEFSEAIVLDDHLPNSYLNLGCAELALKQYAAAVESLRKASSIAPLDLQLKLALAYAEFVNHNYPDVIATANQVHERKHDGGAIVHLFAAAAFEAQGNLTESQQQMETLLQEDPQSPSAGQFRQILEKVKAEQALRAELKLHPAEALTQVSRAPAEPTPEELARRRQFAKQKEGEENQIAEAETATDPACGDCAVNAAASLASSAPRADSKEPGADAPGATLHINVDEISLFFAATDRGTSVTDLAVSDVQIRDDDQPPNAILGFRSESQLPLRLGLVIDTSDSVAERFSFEQAAATRFLQQTAFRKDDLAFVVGVNNVVLLAQDFTSDQELTSRALRELAPSGGTALWDAVAFAADKLASTTETQPVARILVVISDGDDNSSSISLKEAIAHAQRDEVAVYTVSTSDGAQTGQSGNLVGDHALRTLSELTGGAAFNPGSVRYLNRSLADLQQAIRSRYLVFYEPASFQRDGRYRTIDLQAQKNGRPLKVFARKGYYAAAPTGSSTP